MGKGTYYSRQSRQYCKMYQNWHVTFMEISSLTIFTHLHRITVGTLNWVQIGTVLSLGFRTLTPVLVADNRQNRIRESFVLRGTPNRVHFVYRKIGYHTERLFCAQLTDAKAPHLAVLLGNSLSFIHSKAKLFDFGAIFQE